MLDGFKGQGGGASESRRDDQLMGELLATFSELKNRYGTNRLELAYAVLQSLMQHVERHEGLAAMVEFAEKAGEVLTDEAADIHAILDEDFRKNLN